MNNPFLNGLNQNNMQQLMEMVKGNPQGVLNQLMQNNPQVRQVMALANGDPKTAFYSLAKQKGVDPNSILNMLK